MGAILALAISGMTGSSAVGDSKDQPKSTAAFGDRVAEIAPDGAYQAALVDLFNAPDRPTFDRLADQLTALRGGDISQLFPQLLWFAAQHHQDARTKAFVGNVVARVSAPMETIIAALVTQLDNRDDIVRTMTQGLLKDFEDHSATRPPDFSTYRSLIEADVRSGREPQTSLVHFVYSTDPGLALQTMVRACQLRDPAEIKPILWAEHVVADLFWKRRFGFVERKAVDADVLRELDRLSRDPRWWVRLYAAEIVRAHPELGEPEVVKRLTQDTDIRVREHAVRAEAGNSEKE